MLSLLFAPDDDPTAGAAVADPPVETPPVEALETPGEAVPTPEQEQPEGEQPEGVSETPEKKDEAPTLEQVRESAIAQIVDLAESDPEAAAALAEKFGVKPEDVGEEKLDWEREKGQKERRTQWIEADKIAQSYNPQAVGTYIANRLTEVNDNLVSAGLDLQAGKAEDASAIRFDHAAVANEMATAYASGREALRLSLNAGFNDVAVGAMESHVVYSYLSTEERTQLHEAANTGRYDEAIKLFGDAAIRAAPAEDKKKNKQEADEAAGLLDKYAALSLGLGKNSKPGASQSAGSSQPKDETEAHNWHATGKWTTGQMRAWLAKQ